MVNNADIRNGTHYNVIQDIASNDFIIQRYYYRRRSEFKNKQI